MQIKNIGVSIGLSVMLAALCQSSFAADADNGGKANAMEKKFIMKAANGGMTEVELGKVAQEKGGSSDVKDFGGRMVKDHSKANDQLKDVASKLGVTVPDKVNAAHQAMIDKMSANSGAAFDTAYVKAMVKAHEKDIAEFEKADKELSNADLKKFIEDTLPVMKEHLTMIQKFDQAKK